jgi:WD40 repeat protein
VLATLDGHPLSATWVKLSADGRVLMSLGRDRTVKVWEAGTGKLLATLRFFVDGMKKEEVPFSGPFMRSRYGMVIGGNSESSSRVHAHFRGVIDTSSANPGVLRIS